MKKDFFWAKCQNCEKYIIPKLGVVLGTEIISKEENEDIYNNYYSSIYTTFILHSPYELKLNLKKIRKKDGFKIFRAEYFKEEYPSLFWSCIWYFKLYKMNLDDSFAAWYYMLKKDDMYYVVSNDGNILAYK